MVLNEPANARVDDDDDDATTVGDKERGSKKGGGKSKDLSHVPCKFFKVGSCTAGPSCPFSHSLSEPGQAKQVCTWFVKGSCKFGHKCALAHVLPGQPMSMDRRNKKAAQLAAGGGGGGGGGSSGGGGNNERGSKSGRQSKRDQYQQGDRDKERDKEGGRDRERGDRSSRDRNGRGGADDNESSPTTNRLSTTRNGPPGAISAPVPAPPLRDTDFVFGLPDDLPSAPAHPPSSLNPPQVAPPSLSHQNSSEAKPSPLPTPARPSSHRFSSTGGSSDFGYGPIGSPPRSSPGTKPMMAAVSGRRLNGGFSPATSPTSRNFDAPQGGFSSSPFSAPGSKSLFLSYAHEAQAKYAAANGLPASMGESGLRGLREGWGTGRGRMMDSEAEAVAEDEDLEEFLPSSLNELLTPAERERRRSRSGGSRPSFGLGHISRSVPATSLLDNVKSIWGEGLNANAAGGEPGSFSARMAAGDFGSEGPSPSLLGTSNVSAGFLHRPTLGQTHRSFPQSSFEPSSLTNAANAAGTGAGIAMAANQRSSSNNPFGMPQNQPARSGAGVPGLAAGGGDSSDTLSPSSRALQNHAPGQSLPQGLAAGLSRLHLVPFSAQSPGTGGEWSPDGPRAFSGESLRAYSGAAGGADVPGGLSFARTTAGVGVGGPGGRSGISMGAAMSTSPPSSNSFARSRWGMMSPRTRPVATNDEDVLFTMDEEK